MHVSLTKGDGIATLTISRPEALNALNVAVLTELSAAVDEVERDEDVKVLIITGGGQKAFVAGGDIAHMSKLSPLEAKEFSELGQRTLSKIENMKKPVIAAVNGYALGGGNELAMACDIRVASENAVFGQPEVKLGAIAGFGGTQRLTRLIGPGRAKEILFTGDQYDAQSAYAMGLVNKVVPADELEDYCASMAKRIAKCGPFAVSLSKEAVNHGLEMDLEKAFRLESDLFGMVFASGEPQEGMGAFLEKRRPDFKSRA